MPICALFIKLYLNLNKTLIRRFVVCCQPTFGTLEVYQKLYTIFCTSMVHHWSLLQRTASTFLRSQNAVQIFSYLDGTPLVAVHCTLLRSQKAVHSFVADRCTLFCESSMVFTGTSVPRSVVNAEACWGQ